jgi:Tfp pilus assembly protein PilV
MRQGVKGVRGMGERIWETQGTSSRALRLTPHALRSSRGFTILEVIIVLFLLVGLLGIILPRMSLEESLGSVGRRMVGTV